MKKRRTIALFLSLAGLTGAVVFLVWMVDVEAALGVMMRAHAGLLTLAVLMAFALLGLAAVRLWSLTRTAGEVVAFRLCLTAVLASTALNAVIPGRGGDLLKAFFITRDRLRLSALTGVMLVERLIDVLTLSLISALGAGFLNRWQLCIISGSIAAGALTALPVLAFAHRRVHWIPAGLGLASEQLLRRPRRAARAAALSLSFWLLNILLFLTLFRAVNVEVAPLMAAAVVPPALLTGALPFSVGGVGTRDAALVLLLKGRAPTDLVLAASLLYTLIAVWMLALVGAFAVGMGTLRGLLAGAGRARDC